MDRNAFGLRYFYIIKVALRKESVDRNSASRIGKKVENTSLSARRAWIEMHELATYCRR